MDLDRSNTLISYHRNKLESLYKKLVGRCNKILEEARKDIAKLGEIKRTKEVFLKKLEEAYSRECKKEFIEEIRSHHEGLLFYELHPSQNTTQMR